MLGYLLVKFSFLMRLLNARDLYVGGSYVVFKGLSLMERKELFDSFLLRSLGDRFLLLLWFRPTPCAFVNGLVLI